jgi:hypothetical protein
VYISLWNRDWNWKRAQDEDILFVFVISFLMTFGFCVNKSPLLGRLTDGYEIKFFLSFDSGFVVMFFFFNSFSWFLFQMVAELLSIEHNNYVLDVATQIEADHKRHAHSEPFPLL